MTEFQGDVGDFGGSLVLAIAAYNAGPGNAKKWIAAERRSEEPGDRSDRLDRDHPVQRDANYVMRVLENSQIYRGRLAGRDVQTRILIDLYAPNAPAVKVISPFPG